MPYTDAELAEAVEQNRSWRGVLRTLGLQATSAGSLRAARRRADALGIDHSHFTGQRRWSDSDLARAVAESLSWSEVMTHLGVASGSYSSKTLRSRAVRLAINCEHLDRVVPAADNRFPVVGDPRLLRSAATLLAAAWFQLRGDSVSWPLEPARYDLLVESGGAVSRIQVKTTVATESTMGAVSLSTSRRVGRQTYGHDEIDYFFVIDRTLDAYLIPIALVAGRYTIMLSAYVGCRVAEKGDWLRVASLSECASP